MSSTKQLDIVAVATEDGTYYLSERKSLKGRWEGSDLKKCLINGELPQVSFHRDWVSVPSFPKSMSEMVIQRNINYRYELTDKTLISSRLKEFFNIADVIHVKDGRAIYDEDGYRIWKDDMAQYKSLYKEVSDPVPPKECQIEFDIEVVLNVKSVVNPVEMAYKVPAGKYYRGDGFTEITEEDIIYQLADRVIIPEVLLPQRPCKLSSHDTYKIVRQYIKDNIDSGIATVTDYDFCTTVKKRIPLAKVKVYTVDVNNDLFSRKKKRKSKFVERRKSEREEVCFEMTYSPENYRGHTPVAGFKADNQAALKDKIDRYCEMLVEFINTPISDCPSCNGQGVVWKKETISREGS